MDRTNSAKKSKNVGISWINIDKNIHSIEDLTDEEKKQLCDDEFVEIVREEIGKRASGKILNIQGAPLENLRDIIIGFFLISNTEWEYWLDLFEKYLMDLHSTSKYEEMMQKKEEETKFMMILKAFDYIWWIVIIRIIVLIFKWYTDAPTWLRVILWLYFIFWIFSVARSVSRNVDVAKNTNKFIRAICYAKMDIDINANKERVLERLDIEKILSKGKNN